MTPDDAATLAQGATEGLERCAASLVRALNRAGQAEAALAEALGLLANVLPDLRANVSHMSIRLVVERIDAFLAAHPVAK